MQAAPPTPDRRHDLDWLRVIAIVMLLYFHTAMIFTAEWGWHIKNAETSHLLLELNYFLSRFRMALLFLISGLGTAYALGSRGAGGYLRERALRLLLPLAFGVLVVVPPQIYFERVASGVEYGSYLEFWATVFQLRPYPEGSTSWHHLWFVAYLFLYSVLALPFFLWWRGPRGERARAAAERWLAGPVPYLLAGLPLAVVMMALQVRFPGPQNVVDDWARLGFYLLFFVYGFVLCRAEAAWRFLERNRRSALRLAFVSILLINGIRWNGLEPAWGYNPANLALIGLGAFSSWFWVLAILGYGRRYLGFRNRALDYANEGIYPFYIVHQTVIVTVGFYVVQVPESVLAKFLFTSTLSLLLSVAVYHLFIRPFALPRLLFGMKPRRAAAPAPAPASVPRPAAAEAAGAQSAPVRVGALLGGVLLLGSLAPGAAAQEVGWTAYGRDVQGTRYLPADGIDRGNVHRLELAWTYRTGETRPEFATRRPASFQATPLVADGMMYLSTPLGRVIALDPASGRELWVFDPRIRRDVTYGDFANRGVSTWLDPAAPAGAACRRSIYVATAQSLVVVGSSIADNSRPNPASGEVRAFDARTGALRWSWDPIPQDPRDPAHGGGRGTLAHRGGGGNAWSALSADPARDLVFVPTSSPAPDYYGALRLGDNRHASSVVALRLSTGALVWAFQTVRHDLWDYDNAAPPALVTLRRDGAELPAVLQATKTGMLFVLHRETGEPILAVEDRPVPASDIPGEEAAATQPFTAVTPPLSPHRLSADEAWGLTDADRAACRAAIAGLRNEGIFTPPDTRGTLVLPSNIGGAHWGGVAVDPVRQIAVVPVNRLAAMVQLIPREAFDRERYDAEDERLGHAYEYNMMRGTPYVMRRRLLLGPSGLPCSPPPWGALVAVDLASGGILWEVPLGSMTRPLPPELAAQVREEWGSPNLGGPIATAGGVVFIGAALDRWLRAVDIETGRELWRGPLPESGRATPMSYRLENGEQYVVIAVGGGGAFGTGDHLVAFRLPPGADDGR